MSPLLDRLALDSSTGPAAVLLLKGTLLLASAAVAGLALRRSSAASRHLVWTLSLAGMLALPLLSFALPAWRVPVLSAPAADAWTPAPFSAMSAAPASPSVAVPFAAASAASGTGFPVAAQAEPAAPSAMSRLADALPRGLSLVLAIYLLGAAVVLARIATGEWVLRRLARKASAPSDPAWAALLRDLTWMMDVDRPVRLLVSRHATMPMTWGFRRPVVMLPAEADAWPEERRRVVLLHELAHVARHDCLTQLLAGLACAAYWFHPGAWYAARRLRVERERASDDRVLAAGTPGPTYAAHLLDVARAFRSVGFAGPVAVSMARPSQLEGRLLAVLDGVRAHRSLSRRTAGFASVAAVALVLPLAAMRPAARVSASPANAGAWPAAPASAGSPASAAALASSGTPVAPASQQDGTIDRTVAARSGGTLALDLETGGGVTVTGWDREQVRVIAQLGGRDRADTRVTVEPVASGVRVRAVQARSRGSSSTSHSFRVWVPRRFGVRLASAGGGVHISGVQGDFRGETGGGELELRNVSGSARLSTGGGGIDVADSRLSGEVRTGGGHVRLRNVTGGLRGFSGSDGDRVWGDASSRTRVRTGDADGAVTVDVEGDGGPVQVSGNGGAWTVDGGSSSPSAGAWGSGSSSTVTSSGSGTRTTSAGRQQSTTTTCVDGRCTSSTSGGGRSSTTTTCVDGRCTSSTSGERTWSRPGSPESAAASASAWDRDETGSRTIVCNDTTCTDKDAEAGASTHSGRGAARGTTSTSTTRHCDDDGRCTSAEARVEPSGYAYVTGDDDEARRSAIRGMLSGAPPEAAAAAFGRIAFQRDLSADVQREAVRSLGRVAGGSGAEQLARIALSHPRVAVRREAAEVLAARFRSSATPTLREMSRSESDPALRRHVADLLSREWSAAPARRNPADAAAVTAASNSARAQALSAALIREYDAGKGRAERQAVLARLAECGEAASAAKLAAVARGDRDPQLRAAASRYLAKLDAARAARLQAEAASRRS